MQKIRFASRVDADGLVNVAIDEVDDVSMSHYFEEHSEMREVVGVPVYWCEKYGYWPNPAQGWSIHHQIYPI